MVRSVAAQAMPATLLVLLASTSADSAASTEASAKAQSVTVTILSSNLADGSTERPDGEAPVDPVPQKHWCARSCP